MKSVHLLYSKHDLVDHLQRFLSFKRYDVLSVNEKEGNIQAMKKRLFKKDILLDVKVSAVDYAITSLNLSISLKDSPVVSTTIKTDNEEEKLLDSIEASLQMQVSPLQALPLYRSL